MKKGLVLVFFIIIIIGIFVIITFYPFVPKTKEQDIPEAKIDIARIESGEITINQGDSIYFSARNSSDNDGKIESYYWDFDDGSNSEEVDPIHTYEDPGEYTVTLTVVDNDGNKNVTYINIEVINSQPIAIAYITNHPAPNTGVIPIHYSIQFNGSDSYDNDGNITNWYWDFGDGNFSEEPNPKHLFDKHGNYNVSLAVIDNDDETSIDYLEFQIIPRTYSINWELKNVEITVESNGFTIEGEYTELIQEVEQEQLSEVIVLLNWTDRQPFLKNNQSKGEDKFEIITVTPENVTEIENSTSGNISVEFRYKSHISEKNYNADTADDAISKAIEDAGFNGDGVGDWYFNVTALECKGGNWVNDQFDIDVGNTWSLKLKIYYFEIEISDITFQLIE